MSEPFERIAIINRGEAALRVIHAVREFNREAALGIRTIALYTEPERHAMFTREADAAVSLGEASFVDPRDGHRKNAYLDYDRLEEALIASRADAVWVGWGFVAEHPAFAELCEARGLVFIGPSAACMRRLGDKIASKRLAEEARVPIAPWSGGPVETLAEAREQAERIGLPLMVKATAGGGGRGIRAVGDMAALGDAFERARAEALASFGDATVFMEKLVTGARHIEVQVIADQHGNVWPVGLRDCSVQRRHQKLIEESSSPALTPEEEHETLEAAARLCRAAGYRNAGTVEFLFDPETRRLAFMEVNARLQVEHPVTEASTGIDLVKLQLHVARGGRLEGTPPRARGVAIEVRLNAEDPERDFAPSPGLIERFRYPTGGGLRIDTGVEEGDRIPAEFDSMIAKLIAFGSDREEALSRLERGLNELAIVVRGGTTNRAFLLDLLSRPEVRDGVADVGWLDRSPPSSWQLARPHGEIALILAAIENYLEEFDAERAAFLASAARGRPSVSTEVGRSIELRHAGNTYGLRVFRHTETRYRVDVDGAQVDVEAERRGRFAWRLSCGDRVHRALSITDGKEFLIEIDGIPQRVSRDTGGAVRAPAPAVVVSVAVEPGDRVAPGDTLAILEAMKMEMRITAPFAGVIRSVEVTRNEQVPAGAALLHLKPASDTGVAGTAERVVFAHLEQQREHQGVRDRCRRSLRQLRCLILGFDVDEKAAERLLAERPSLCAGLPAEDPELLQRENHLLETFADIAALSQRMPEFDTEFPGVVQRSPRESFFTYLRAPEAQGEGLSGAFLDKLRAALDNYGIEDLAPRRTLYGALLRIYKSHTRIGQQLPTVMSILERRLQQADKLLPSGDEEFRRLLDRLIMVSQRRSRALEDLTREVRYRYFDEPLAEAAKQEVYQQAEAHLSYLAAHSATDDRRERIDQLISLPQPLMTLLSDWHIQGDAAMQALTLEVLTRRYYRIRELHNIRIATPGGHPVFEAEYDHEGVHILVLSTHADLDTFRQIDRILGPRIETLPQEDDAVIDIYVRRGEHDQPLSEEGTLQEVQGVLDAMTLPRAIRRIAVSVRIPGAGLGVTGQHYFTFRPQDGGTYREDTIYRGMHPMMAKRLQLWRLSNFRLRRIPSEEDVYLFHAVSRDNPKDERLFAIAEVRMLIELRDENGKLTGLPTLERMALAALAGIRRFQFQRPPRRRLHWNRILLYLWPLGDLNAEEVQEEVQRLASASIGLGLERLVVHARVTRSGSQEPEPTELIITNPLGRGPVLRYRRPLDRPIRPLTPYRQKVLKMRQRGLVYPYEIIRLLTRSIEDDRSSYPPGEFIEYDFDDDGRLAPLQRLYGENRANVVVGVIRNFTGKFPEGMARVMILGDPSRDMGSLAEPECSRIIAALDMAESMNVPVEWFAVSAGAKIAMESGTENLDWTAAVLKRLVEFTQAGREVNVIVHAINVGAQSYWNAEATMLMHCRGVLIMTDQGAMVLTGKRALDYSGGVSAEDNLGIGGYGGIMGPNGQAQYWASDVDEACQILLRHYEHCYVLPGERFPRKGSTRDPTDRAIDEYLYDDAEEAAFHTVGEVFSDQKNPGRKKPFDIRRIMRAVSDQDLPPLERWSSMRDAEIAVVWDVHLGGYPVSLIGIESRPLPRPGFIPADGPDQWTAGTLFPQSSRKIAWAINAASANRPVVVLANLSGFDGSPESMRRWQLEYGAEIGRAVVNFEGPIVFCVVSRYHGGAFVVFSKSLNPHMEVAALEGAYASVIGGAPAAAVVFAREVRTATNTDPRIRSLEERISEASDEDRVRLRQELDALYKSVRAENRGELAVTFDRIHSVQRARDVGSVDYIVPPAELRSYLIDAVERGIRRLGH